MCLYLARLQPRLHPHIFATPIAQAQRKQTCTIRNTACMSTRIAKILQLRLHVFFATQLANVFCNCACMFFFATQIARAWPYGNMRGCRVFADSELFFPTCVFLLDKFNRVLYNHCPNKGEPHQGFHRNRHVQGFLHLLFLIFYEIIRLEIREK